MKSETKLALIGASIGLVGLIILAYAKPLIALGVFLMLWGNNIHYTILLKK